MSSDPLLLNTYEDRPACWLGVKLLALSLARHLPNARLGVWGLPSDGEMRNWFDQQDNVDVKFGGLAHVSGWDVKPSVLLTALSAGEDPAYWIDADIILAGDLESTLQKIPDLSLVATEETLFAEEPQGSGTRIEDLGLTSGRHLSRTVNTCFMRVGGHHSALLDRWRDILASPPYRSAQGLPFALRPLGFRSDQDVLTALLSSEDFARVEIHLLKEGYDIAQCMHSLGYRASARLRSLVSGLPPLIHAQGEKPWGADASLSTQLSPYCSLAASYRHDTLADESMDWTRPQSPVARLLDHIALGHPALRGLPLSLLREIQKRGSSLFRMEE